MRLLRGRLLSEDARLLPPNTRGIVDEAKQFPKREMAMGNTTGTASKAKAVLFLGSGFSAALGLPTTDQLSGKLLRSYDDHELKPVEDFISARISEFWKAIFGWRPGMRPPALEDHFTQIDLTANAGHRLGTGYSPRRLRAIRRMTIHRIFSLVKSQGSRDPHVVEMFRKMNETFELTLVTTNWDAEAESSLELLGIPINYGLDEITAIERQAPADGVSVLKLHGCANRGFCDCCRSIIRFEGIEDAVIRLRLLLDEEDFKLFEDGTESANILRALTGRSNRALGKCHDCDVRLGLRVGTFSYRKDLSPDAFYTIWDKARTNLQFAEKWLFIGYSLPEADIEIRHLLKSAQLARRDPSRVSIEIILKGDCHAGERYRRFFGLREDHVFQGGLDDWIANRLGWYCG